MSDPRIRCQILLLLAALLVALLAPLAAAADVIDYVNSVRRHGWGGYAGGLVPLRAGPRPDEVAAPPTQGRALRGLARRMPPSRGPARSMPATWPPAATWITPGATAARPKSASRAAVTAGGKPERTSRAAS